MSNLHTNTGYLHALPQHYAIDIQQWASKLNDLGRSKYGPRWKGTTFSPRERWLGFYKDDHELACAISIDWLLAPGVVSPITRLMEAIKNQPH